MADRAQRLHAAERRAADADLERADLERVDLEREQVADVDPARADLPRAPQRLEADGAQRPAVAVAGAAPCSALRTKPVR
jgi:hypothetical protein